MIIPLVHLLIFYASIVKGNCELKPMMHGYYAGYSKLSYIEAKYCCRSKDMSLVSILNQHELTRLHETLLSESSRDSPVGPLNGYRTSAILQGDWNISNFYWDGIANSFDSLLPLPKTIELWGEDLPNNDISLFGEVESCATIYLPSPDSFSIEMDDISCKHPLSYICEKSKSNESEQDPCGNVTFNEFNQGNFLFSSEKLSWRKASHCCSTKHAVLLANPFEEETKKALKEIIAESKGNKNKTFMMWTSGYKDTPQSNYMWPNDEVIPNYVLKKNKEYCIAVKYTTNHSKLLEFPCENSLPFVCVVEPSPKCSFIEMTPLNMTFVPSQYYHSGDSKVTWREAFSCCKQKKMRLISIVSHEQGTLLSAKLDALHKLPRRHIGFDFGIWTSGRLQPDGKVKFLSLKQSFHVGKRFENNYLIKGSGQCLQFVMDSRNSYLMNNILCKSYRPFICESDDGKRVAEKREIKFSHLGGKYFYSSRATNWHIANEICDNNGFKLLTITNEDENNALHPLVQELKKHTSPGSGLWTGASLLNSSNGNSKQFIWLSNGENIFYNSYMKYDLDIKSTPENCMVVFATSEGLFWEDFDCSSQKHFICQYEGDSYCKRMLFSSRGDKYFVSTKPLKWSDARKCCEKNSAQLVSITSLYENDMLSRDVPRVSRDKQFNGFWTSGTNKMVSASFMWASTGEPVRFSNFLHTYRPSRHLKKNQCIEIFKHSGNHITTDLVWNLDYCDRKKAFICQAEKELEPTCKDIEISRLQKSKYFYGRGEVSWGRAVECCDAQGMDLAEIYDNNENDNLYTLLLANTRKRLHSRHNTGVWIGLSTFMKTSQYSWLVSGQVVNQSEVPYWNGAPEGIVELEKSRVKAKGVKLQYRNGEEVFSGAGCVEAYIDLKENTLIWHNLPCTYRLGFVCQVRIAVNDKRDFQPPMKTRDFTLEHVGAHYYYSPKKESWWNAMKVCSDLGTTLLSIEDQEENTKIQKLFIEKSQNSLRAYFENVKVWTSGTDQHKEGSYWWAGVGKKMHYHNINGSSSNLTRVQMDCVSISLKGTLINWQKERCAMPLSFVCERPEKQTCTATSYTILDPPETEGRIIANMNAAYFISYIHMNWLAASAYCKRHRMELVSLETNNDVKIIRRGLKNSHDKSYYTSGTNLGAIGTLVFRWSSNGKGVHTALRVQYNGTMLEIPMSKTKISQSTFENSTRMSYSELNASKNVSSPNIEENGRVVVSLLPLCLVFVGGTTETHIEAVHCSKPYPFICKTPTECF